MQRGRNKAVTLPIVIPASHEKEGFVSVQNTVKAVRELRNDDLRGASKAMAVHEAKHFSAVTMLGRALSRNSDLLAVKKASLLLSEARVLEMKAAQASEGTFPAFPEPDDSGREEMSFASALTALSAVPPGQKLKALLKVGTRTDPYWLLAREVSKAIAESKLVLWWTGVTFRPAVWCPDLKTAFYTCGFFRRLHICPHCSAPFFPDRPDQNYCSVAHREAHRVARWRSKNKKQAARKKGGKWR